MIKNEFMGLNEHTGGSINMDKKEIDYSEITPEILSLSRKAEV